MVQIVTDSAADFEPEELERLGVVCIPLCVSFGETEYQENVNLSKDEFYRLLKKKKTFPKTAQPSLHTYESVLSQAMDSGCETVMITLSSGLSGFCHTAKIVKNMLKYEDCYIIDSLTATAGQRILVEHAVKLRDEGKSAKEIAEALMTLRSKISLFACMDTLEYLCRGGRISHTKYAISTVAGIKPIIHVTKEGKVEVVSKTIGMRRGIEYIVKKLIKNKPDKGFPIYVMYTYAQKNGELLAEALKKYGYEIPLNHIKNVGAAIGAHIGPDACGLVYVTA